MVCILTHDSLHSNRIPGNKTGVCQKMHLFPTQPLRGMIYQALQKLYQLKRGIKYCTTLNMKQSHFARHPNSTYPIDLTSDMDLINKGKSWLKQ